jgi:hypothetical protein
MRNRSVWVEPLFAEFKDWHGLHRWGPAGCLTASSERHCLVSSAMVTAI